MSWAVFVTASVLLVLFRGRTPKFASKGAWLINAFLAFVAGGALANIVIGDWITAAMGGLFDWVGSWFGVAASVVGGVVILFVVFVVIADLSDRVADTPAIVGLIMIPLIAVSAGGPIADAAQQIYGSAEQVGMSSLGQLVGG